MFDKFSEMSDDELVFAYKQKKDDDIELELISRYQIHSRKLAGEIYRKFKFLYQLEYEDIFAIAISTLFTAIKTFTKKGFFKYWKTCTNNEMNSYIRHFNVTKSDALVFSSLTDDLSSSIIFKERPSTNVESYSLHDDIMLVMDQNEKEFDEADKVIFLYYLEGYKITEICELIGRKKSFVRNRLNIIKDKLADILFNQ